MFIEEFLKKQGFDLVVSGVDSKGYGMSVWEKDEDEGEVRVTVEISPD